MNFINEHKEKLLNLFFDFQKILIENNLWYVAEFGTLLGAIREGEMIEWDDDIDLGISVETYYFLKEKYPKNILDTDVNGYPFLFPKWVNDINEWNETNVFLDLFIIIPTTMKKLQKFASYKHIIRFTNQMFNKGSKYKSNDFTGRILQMVFWPIQWIFKKISIQENLDILYEKEKAEFLFLINLPIFPIKEIYEHKRDFKILERDLISFHDKYIHVPKNYDEVLKISYGSNYMTPILTNSARVHTNTINSISIKKYNKIKNKRKIN